jgi:hypothetical protein
VPSGSTGVSAGQHRRRFVPYSFPQIRPAHQTESEKLAYRAKLAARPTGFEPVTFGFVDRGVSSVGLVWARDLAPHRDSSSSEFVWTPSRLLPFCCPRPRPRGADCAPPVALVGRWRRLPPRCSRRRSKLSAAFSSKAAVAYPQKNVAPGTFPDATPYSRSPAASTLPVAFWTDGAASPRAKGSTSPARRTWRCPSPRRGSRKSHASPVGS